MKLEELKNHLEAIGYPVAYSHFVETENNPIPEPPFICYLVAYSSNFQADNKTFLQGQVVQVELYTDKKDLVAEDKLEQLLNSIELPFASTETYIDSEKLHQKIYEVRLF
jgi:hypothetical protein